MANYYSAIKKVQYFLDRVNKLREECDKEGHYWRKDPDMRSRFNDISDSLEEASRAIRSVLREAQTMEGYECPCMATKKTVKKSTKKPSRK